MRDSTEFVPERGAQIAGVVAIAATYFYFLIFAEFAFLELGRAQAGSATQLRLLMTVLGLGGIGGSLLAAKRFRLDRFPKALGNAFRFCGAAAAVTLVARGWWPMLAAALAVGFTLGWLTVTLCAGLRACVGTPRLGLVAGAGTGLAYALCNLPVVFNATPYAQTVMAAFVAGAGAITAGWMRPWEPSVSTQPDYRPGGIAVWIAVLLALVWMDSAAFYIIQHTAALRGETWGSTGSLMANAVTHLVAALAAGYLLDRDWPARTVLAAFGLLAAACVLLDAKTGGFIEAEMLYTAGVSLYSVVLLHYPARGGRVWVAALVFAIAGWVGSAMGIGMAQDLNRVPLPFVFAAGLVVIGGLAWRRRVQAPVALIAIAAGFLLTPDSSVAQGATPEIARGRAVYIREGCIHCHSQFVRPGTPDETRWGPARPLSAVLAAEPPLLGNRRQGPDLAEVGARRSAEWNRLHLMAPRDISPGSRMPSYAHLFSDRTNRGGVTDGDALVAYLASLGEDAAVDRQVAAMAWNPASAPVAAGEAARLFSLRCASCHGADGRGQGVVASRLPIAPPDFQRDPWRYVRDGAEPSQTVARIIRYGLPGSAMAGHEDLSDAEVAGLARHVISLHEAGPALAAGRRSP